MKGKEANDRVNSLQLKAAQKELLGTSVSLAGIKKQVVVDLSVRGEPLARSAVRGRVKWADTAQRPTAHVAPSDGKAHTHTNTNNYGTILYVKQSVFVKRATGLST